MRIGVSTKGLKKLPSGGLFSLVEKTLKGETGALEEAVEFSPALFREVILQGSHNLDYLINALADGVEGWVTILGRATHTSTQKVREYELENQGTDLRRKKTLFESQKWRPEDAISAIVFDHHDYAGRFFIAGVPGNDEGLIIDKGSLGGEQADRKGSFRKMGSAVLGRKFEIRNLHNTAFLGSAALGAISLFLPTSYYDGSEVVQTADNLGGLFLDQNMVSGFDRGYSLMKPSETITRVVSPERAKDLCVRISETERVPLVFNEKSNDAGTVHFADIYGSLEEYKIVRRKQRKAKRKKTLGVGVHREKGVQNHKEVERREFVPVTHGAFEIAHPDHTQGFYELHFHAVPREKRYADLSLALGGIPFSNGAYFTQHIRRSAFDKLRQIAYGKTDRRPDYAMDVNGIFSPIRHPVIGNYNHLDPLVNPSNKQPGEDVVRLKHFGVPDHMISLVIRGSAVGDILSSQFPGKVYFLPITYTNQRKTQHENH